MTGLGDQAGIAPGLAAALMGFGAMPAGGRSIGAGVTGGSALTLTAWIALTATWTGARRQIRRRCSRLLAGFPATC